MRSQQAFLETPFFLSIPVISYAKISKTLNCPQPLSFSVASLSPLLTLIMSWASPGFLYISHHLWCLAACPKLGTCCPHKLTAQAKHRCWASFPTTQWILNIFPKDLFHTLFLLKSSFDNQLNFTCLSCKQEFSSEVPSEGHVCLFVLWEKFG